MRGSRGLFRTSAIALSFTMGSALLGADHPMLGESAPMFELHSLDGEQWISNDLRGQVIVLHFGAGW